MRVAVTGAGGRLGRAVVAALAEAPFTGLGGPLAWTRPAFDLDRPAGFGELLARDRPEVVVHAAAWTDVDGCARDPELAMARNGLATGELARVCAAAGTDLVVVSTNEVFDGRRADRRGYRPDDTPNPINPYGVSKLAGERLARQAYAMTSGIGASISAYQPPSSREPGGGAFAGPQLAIIRTAWLFGPPGHDFPAKILAAAMRSSESGEPLKVVGDEFGSPTYSNDLAEGVADLLGAGYFAGIHHLVNTGGASRAAWARELFRQAALRIEIEEVPASTWPRASTPPTWTVLEPTPLPGREPLRPWQDALADYLPALLRGRAVAGR